ncbi:MAG: hypothetical protein JWN08_3066, partial [Frankiales bacterium]|nr:hypothetical protein [Frankiales bacterium]
MQRSPRRAEAVVAALSAVVLVAGLPDSSATAAGAVAVALTVLVVGVLALRLLRPRQ